jgi:hypothetical protein
MRIIATLKRRVSQGPGVHSVYGILKTGGIQLQRIIKLLPFFSDKFANEKLSIL